MKNLIISILTIAMALYMGTISALATTDVMTAPGEKEIDVKAVYSDKATTPTVYSVDLVWGTMEFTYTETGSKIWDAKKNQYDVSTEASWIAKGNAITVTNHSNIAVTADFSFAALPEYSTVTGAFSNGSISLATADKENVTAAELTGTTALTLGGTLDKAVNTLTNIGKITVILE